MNAAIQRLESLAPAGSLLLADAGTTVVLRYYLDPWGPIVVRPAGYRLVRSPFWAPDEKRFGDELERLVWVYRLSAGESFWVVRLGSEYDLTAVVSRRLPSASCPVAMRYGDVSVNKVLLHD